MGSLSALGCMDITTSKTETTRQHHLSFVLRCCGERAPHFQQLRISAEESALITHCTCILGPLYPGCIHSHLFQSSQSILAASSNLGCGRGCIRAGRSLFSTP